MPITARTWTGVSPRLLERLDGEASSEPPGKLLLTAGSTLVSTVGGASGPLWGTALRRAGRVARRGRGVRRLRSSSPRSMRLSRGVVDLGAASEGEKTMVDALAPAVRVLRERVETGAGLAEALAAAREAGEEGMRATVPLQARKGRASYLGERSIGHQDPGATSTALILAALERSAAAEA